MVGGTPQFPVIACFFGVGIAKRVLPIPLDGSVLFTRQKTNKSSHLGFIQALVSAGGQEQIIDIHHPSGRSGVVARFVFDICRALLHSRGLEQSPVFRRFFQSIDIPAPSHTSFFAIRVPVPFSLISIRLAPAQEIPTVRFMTPDVASRICAVGAIPARCASVAPTMRRSVKSHGRIQRKCKLLLSASPGTRTLRLCAERLKLRRSSAPP